MRPELLLALARADVLGAPIVTLRSNGVDVGADRRDEMLQQVKAGAYVELDVEVLAYEQRAGEMNRNYVRFRDGSMMALGRTGKGKPFLRDHEQHDVNARAGTILESRTEKGDEEGSYTIRMTARLTAPWAVELALRGLLSTVSIGWTPTGPVECSACAAAIFTKCYHWPGDRLRETTDADGNPIRVRDRAGSITVQWIYTSAELVECSVVSVPAVPGAHIDVVRAALAAAHPEFRASLAPDGDGFPVLSNGDEMKNFAALVAILSLAPTASEEEALRAAEQLKRDRDTATTKLQIAEGERDTLRTEVSGYREKDRKNGEDTFIRDALSSGRIAIADEPVWRKLFALNADDAKAEMAKRLAGCSTPVGQPRQTPAMEPAPTTGAPSGGDAQLAAQIAATGADPAITLGLAKAFGVKDINKSIPQAIGLNKEV